ncbi:MAG: PAS-domain containing protein [Hyphomicrobiales bacterium]|nr:PAS-domain containing protein [Hyphomicrobiales bacterium]
MALTPGDQPNGDPADTASEQSQASARRRAEAREDRRRMRRGDALLAGVALAALALTALFALGGYKLVVDETRVDLRNTLEAILDDTRADLVAWEKRHREAAVRWSQDADVRRWVAELMQVPREPAFLVDAYAQSGLRKQLVPLMKAAGQSEFFIIAGDGTVLASSLPGQVGTRGQVMDEATVQRRLAEGEVALSLPRPSPVSLPDARGNVAVGHPVMYLVAPVAGYGGESDAVLVTFIDATAEFSSIFQRARLGLSGETYAFDRTGLMVSESRFDQQLRQIGLIGDVQTSILNVQVRDPGRDLLRAADSTPPLDDGPLTLAVRQAVAGGVGDRGVNVTGYRDYRGVPVAGAWVWHPTLGVGMVTELDLDEALASLRPARLTIAALAILSAVLVVLQALGYARSARAVLRRERSLAAIIDTAADGIITIGGDGIVTRFSAAAERIFGYRAGEVVGRNVSLLMPGREGGLHDDYLRAYAETGESRVIRMSREVVGRHKDGRDLPLELAVADASVGDETVFTGIVRDISERKAAEAALAEKEHQLSAALTHMSDAMYMLDSEGRFVLANERLRELLDLPDDVEWTRRPTAEWVGQPVAELIRAHAVRGDYGWGDPDELTAKRLEELMNDAHVRREMAFDDDQRFVELRKSPTAGGGAVVVISDTTQQKMAEVILAEKEEMFRLALNNMSDGVYSVDEDLNFRVFNRRYVQLLGLPDNLVAEGRPMTGAIRFAAENGFYGPGDVDEIVEERLADYREPGFREREVVSPDGTVINIRITALVGGGAVVALTDRTERRKAEQELAEAFGIISDSIHYASRIQRSILPAEKFLGESTSDHFVVWQPRDQVGGDMYWYRRLDDGFLIALGDCTGHGVPGAFMTLIATGALDRAIRECPEGDPSRVLRIMNRSIKLVLGQYAEIGESDDGMDIGVCRFFDGTTRMTFAGAKFSVFLSEVDGVHEVKGDKVSLGYRTVPLDQPYTNHEVPYTSETRFYLATDGLTDQVGGDGGRMFGKRRALTMFHTLRDMSMDEQRENILATFDAYQGSQNRRDDLTLIGFKVRV